MTGIFDHAGQFLRCASKYTLMLPSFLFVNAKYFISAVQKSGDILSKNIPFVLSVHTYTKNRFRLFKAVGLKPEALKLFWLQQG